MTERLTEAERRILREIDARIERLEDVAARWDTPGGSKRLARRALDKADGLRVARRLLDRADPVEEGRRLASQRDDLIAQGVDPAALAIVHVGGCNAGCVGDTHYLMSETQPVDWSSPSWGGGVHHATTDDLGDHGRHSDETQDQ